MIDLQIICQKISKLFSFIRMQSLMTENFNNYLKVENYLIWIHLTQNINAAEMLITLQFLMFWYCLGIPDLIDVTTALCQANESFL